MCKKSYVFIADILKYDWQIDFEKQQIKVEVTFNQLVSGKDSGAFVKEYRVENINERPINGMKIFQLQDFFNVFVLI